jgi:DHA1 family bicyclomycin/chloramphenicol resistance-like MFS transporter
MDRHGAIAGTAAALMGSLHFAVGALAMLLVGWLGSGQPLAMLLGIAGCALASWALGMAVLTGQRQAALTDV